MRRLYMEWKRRLELLGGLATAGLGVIVVIGAVNESQQIAQTQQEPAATGKAFVVAMILYGLPALLVALGAFTHAIKRQPWGRMLLIAATVFLVVWFFLSFPVLAWTAWFWPITLLTALAFLTSIISLLVRSEK